MILSPFDPSFPAFAEVLLLKFWRVSVIFGFYFYFNENIFEALSSFTPGLFREVLVLVTNT